jgi:hypothetical protein
MKPKKSGAGTKDLYKPKLAAGEYLRNSVSYEANCFIIVGMLDALS